MTPWWKVLFAPLPLRIGTRVFWRRSELWVAVISHSVRRTFNRKAK